MQGLVDNVERHGVHREVPSQEVVFEPCRERHHRLPGIRQVRLGPVRRDLEGVCPQAGSDGAELLALEPDGVRHPLDEPADAVRRGVGGQVEVGVVPDPAQEHIAYDPADEVEPLAVGGKPPGQGADHRTLRPEERTRRCRSHRSTSPCSTAASSTAALPGPSPLAASGRKSTPIAAATAAPEAAASPSRS